MIRSSIAPLFVLCMFVGCDDPKSSLGELPEASSGTTHPFDATATADESGPASESGDTDGIAVGAPCQLSGVPESYALELDNPGCATGMCIYANTTVANPGQTCTKASDCDGFTDGVICTDAGTCELDPDYINARTMCTDACVEDADCSGVDGSSCMNGFACLPVAQLGAACCQPVCVCLDDFDATYALPLQQSCADGTAACCVDHEPVPAACPG